MGRLVVRAVLAGVSLVGVSACGSQPSRCSGECCAYITCYEKAIGPRSALDSTYGANGTCWTTTTAAADSCTASCKAGISGLKTMFPDAGCADK